MGKIVILDYTAATVDFYDVDSDADINEEYIEKLGYNTNNCEWMFTTGDITFHKEELK